MEATQRGRIPLRIVLIPPAAVIILLTGFILWKSLAVDSMLASPSPAEAVEPAPALAEVPSEASAERARVPAEAAASPTAPAQVSGAASDPIADDPTSVSLVDQLRPPGGYPLPASFGDLGPRLVAAGGIDYDRFAQLYLRNGQPLTGFQVAVLKEGSDSQIVIDAENAYFLLNFFWAVGLTNQNRILEEGPMMDRGSDQVGGFASTGGWTLGTKPATELFSSTPLIPLTADQQTLVEEVADAIYRPCCGNPTSFPDCNHGMAMLGLLELMASQGATLDEIFTATKYVNAFWYPQQAMEVALYFQAAEGLSFSELDARRAFGNEFFSGAGYSKLHRWLADNNMLQQMPGQGGSCGV